MNNNLTLFTFFVSMLFFLSACGQTADNNQGQTLKANTLTIDTSKYAILKFDTTDKWIFNNVRPASLKQSEIEEIEILLKHCIDAYNPDQQLQFDTISKAHPEYNLRVENFVINLSRYKRSIFPLISRAKGSLGKFFLSRI